MRQRSFWMMIMSVFSVLTPLNMAKSQPVSAPPSYAITAPNAPYADIADLVTIAPMIIDANVQKIRKIIPEQAIGLPETVQRVLIEADVNALIRGSSGVASQVKFLLDIPKDARGKIPNLKKQRFLIMANAVPGRPTEIRLIRPGAMIAYSPENDQIVRAIAREVVQSDDLGKITGISSAFFSPGTVIGDGETQIFLMTENKQPLSITISSRGKTEKQWSVSTSELIEETATTPKPYTLLWYRLACGLPRTLPPELVGSGNGAHAARAQADYHFVIMSLGPCGRSR